MKRCDNWPERLLNAVQVAQLLPFRYGVHDCCTFAAYCVDAMCGSDVSKQMQKRHPYQDKDGAYRVIAEAGGFAALVSLYLGEPLADYSELWNGDVVVTRDRSLELVGVVLDGRVIAPRDPDGLCASSLKFVTHAWRV